MKKNLRVFVYLMIVVIVAAGVFLWAQNRGNEKILDGLDPESYDVEATCTAVEGNNLICNAGNDMYLYLDGAKVYLRNYDVEQKENGDEVTRISYRDFSMDDLKKELEEKKEVPIYLWLTKNGKVKVIMAGRETWENNNSSLASLDGLDPDASTSTNVILSMNKSGIEAAPAGYTPETADKFEDLITSYRFTKGVKFYKGTVTVTVDEEGNRSRNIWYEKDSYSAVRQRLGQGLTAHLWINEAGRVYAVLIHEEKVVLE